MPVMNPAAARSLPGRSGRGPTEVLRGLLGPSSQEPTEECQGLLLHVGRLSLDPEPHPRGPGVVPQRGNDLLPRVRNRGLAVGKLGLGAIDLGLIRGDLPLGLSDLPVERPSRLGAPGPLLLEASQSLDRPVLEPDRPVLGSEEPGLLAQQQLDEPHLLRGARAGACAAGRALGPWAWT